MSRDIAKEIRVMHECLGLDNLGSVDCPKCGGDEEAEALVCQMCEDGTVDYNCERETGVGGDSREGECDQCQGSGYIECPCCEGTGEPVDPTGC